MSFSPFQGYIRFLDTDVNADNPIGVDSVRASLLSNLLYNLDGQGQFRVNWIIQALSHEIVPETDSGVIPSLEFAFMIGTWIDVHVHPSSGAYVFRTRVGARNTQNIGTAKIRLGIGHPENLNEALPSLTASLPSNFVEHDLTSNVHAWVDGVSLLTVPEAQVVKSIYGQATRLDVAVPDAITTVPVCRLACWVWGLQPVGTEIGLSGLVVSEWIGD